MITVEGIVQTVSSHGDNVNVRLFVGPKHTGIDYDITVKHVLGQVCMKCLKAGSRCRIVCRENATGWTATEVCLFATKNINMIA